MKKSRKMEGKSRTGSDGNLKFRSKDVEKNTFNLDEDEARNEVSEFGRIFEILNLNSNFLPGKLAGID